MQTIVLRTILLFYNRQLMSLIKKTFLSFLFLSFIVFNASAIDVVFEYPNGQNICGKSLMTIKITATQNMGPVNAELQLNSSMMYDSIWTSVQNSYIVKNGNNLKIFFDTLVGPGTVWRINARLNSTSSCSSVNCSQLQQVQDVLILRYNGVSQTFNNQNFLKSPCISYDETEFSNRLQSASVGDTIIRSLVLRNTGAGAFSGLIKLVDNYRSNIEIDTVYTTSSALQPGSFSDKTGDSTYTYTASFLNLLNASSITITERVIVKKCIENDEGKSSIYIDWGCGNTTCQKINPYPITAQVLKDYRKPEIEIKTTHVTNSSCIDDVTHYRFVAKNKGTQRAVDLSTTILYNNKNTYSYIVPGSLVMSDTAGMYMSGFTEIHNYVKPDYVHTCIPPNPLTGYSFKFSQLPDTDSFIVEMDVRSCCPQLDTMNTAFAFDDFIMGLEYVNVCKTGKTTAISSSLDNTSLYWKQTYEPEVTDMAGDPVMARDTVTFEILNNGFSTSFYKLDLEHAVFKIVLKTDSGLAYVGQNPLYIKSQFGYNLYPFKIEKVVGASAEGYQDTMIVASFAFPDTFNINDQFFQKFFRYSSVVFDLRSYCYAPGPQTRFTQEVYLETDTNCISGCKVLLSSLTNNIAVHCPGCITPGWVSYDYKVQRTTYGENDNNNDRLPDFATYVKPDLTKIKRNRFTVGDTIITELSAYLQDGDLVKGKTMDQLENNGANSFQFKYNYLRTTINDGKIYDLNYVKVYITDVDKDAFPSGLDSVMLPESTVLKIGNPNDSLADAQYYYDLSLDTLYKYGLSTNYKYEVFDQVRVVTCFTILDPADFYLTPNPPDKDPWKIFSHGSYRPQLFTNLMYLTGEKDTPFDTDVDASSLAVDHPEQLDSTQIYWCEGYGGAGSWIGRNPILVTEMPGNVYCKADGNVRIELNPGKDVFPNPFPFEFRKFVTVDSIRIYLPSGYQLIESSLSSVIEAPLDGVEYLQCGHISSNFKKRENGNVYTVYVDSTYNSQTQFGGSPCPSTFVNGDEYYNSILAFRLKANCNPGGTQFYHAPEIYYTLNPGNIKKKFELVLNPSIKSDTANLQLTPASNDFQLNQPKYCYPITLEEKQGHDAYHSFIKIVSLDGKLKPDTLFSLDQPSLFFLPDTTGAFRLDTLKSLSLNKFNLCLANQCSENFTKDSIRLYFGYDCDTYPNKTISNICHKNFITHYFQPADLDIQSYLESPAQIKMCDQFDLSYVANITGIGKVKNFVVNILKEDLKGIYYKKGTIEYNGTSIKIPETVIDGHVIDMDSSIKVLKPAGLVPGDNIKINLTLYTNCVYEQTHFRFFAKAVTASCDTIYDDTLDFLPAVALEYPKPDQLTLTGLSSSATNLGGEVELSLQLENNATSSTGNNHFIELPLPAGYVYKKMNSGDAPLSITDTLLTWKYEQNLTAGQSRVLKIVLAYPPKNNCDTLKSKMRLIQRYKTACDGYVCFIQSDTFDYFVPFVCTPCPPIITIGDTCKGIPIQNTLHWTGKDDFFCFEDSLKYKVYFSENVEPLKFTLLASLNDSSFVHRDLASYDACYYVTATSKAGVESPPSNTVCNKTCADQFICNDLFIANLITRNGDNKNDTFIIKGAYLKLRVEILNRWGDRVYLSEDYKNDFTGENLEAGIYYYSVSAGNDKACNGWLHLVK